MYISAKLKFSCSEFKEWTSCGNPYIKLLFCEQGKCSHMNPREYIKKTLFVKRKGWHLNHRLI